MKTSDITTVTVETTVNESIDRVWKIWSDPEHIMQWNSASADWYTPHAENDLRTGGRFLSRMSSRDGTVAFDFSGTYDIVEFHKRIKYTMDDNRKVEVLFTTEEDKTRITETFEAENENSIELQKNGWQAILENFRKHVETLKGIAL